MGGILEQLSMWVYALEQGGSIGKAALGAFFGGALDIASSCALPFAPVVFLLALTSAMESDEPVRRGVVFGFGLLLGVGMAFFWIDGLYGFDGHRQILAYRPRFLEIGAGLLLAIGAFLSFLALFWVDSARSMNQTVASVLGGLLIAMVMIASWQACSGTVYSTIANFQTVNAQGEPFGSITRLVLMVLFGLGLGFAFFLVAILGGLCTRLFPQAVRFGPLLFGLCLLVLGWVAVTGGFNQASGKLLQMGYPLI